MKNINNKSEQSNTLERAVVSQSIIELEDQSQLLQRGSELLFESSVNQEIKATIALVYADEFMRAFYKELLEDRQYKVYTLVDPEQLIELLQKEEIDLIFSEKILAKKKAYDVLKVLRATITFKTLPIAILSDNENLVESAELFALGNVKVFYSSQVAPDTVLDQLDNLITESKKNTA